MKSQTILPALRARVGDWTYYVTTLTFDEVDKLVKSSDEIHERKRLSDWIQREAIDKHAKEVADYIKSNPQRFLGSLIIGVYDGSPDWSPITLDNGKPMGISESQSEKMTGRLGILQLSGAEKLFAIDGQHRVAGIKTAISKDPDNETLRGDSVSAIFVGHDPSSNIGKIRTRRLFTTVNKRARIISSAAAIALDEDNGFAVVTRRIIDKFWLFDDKRKLIVFASTGAIATTDSKSITSVVGLYEIVRALYGPPKGFDKERPSEEALEDYLSVCIEFFDALLENVPEFTRVFIKNEGVAGDYRQASRNHLLFRPAGQLAFCKALQLLVSRGNLLVDGVKTLLKAEMYLQNEPWHNVMWDPVAKTMITGKTPLAEAQLLRLSKQELRTKVSGQRLDELIKAKKAALA